jgi:septum formation protein
LNLARRTLSFGGVNPFPEIILASASPRRAGLLRQIGLPFRVAPSAVDEEEHVSSAAEARPEELATRLALAKAQTVARRLGRGLVLGADTMVVCDEAVLGKPRDTAEAQAFLIRLSGRTHRVITGVALLQAETGRAEVATAVTAVRMRPFDAAEAAAYVATGEPMDKAGGYAVQGRGALLVEAIEGEYSNVVGLPLITLAELLRRFGLEVWALARP